jgi:4-hydroxy-2-oxoheptanedioate aldolase
MVIRIPSNEPVIFKRLLDAGVRSFMVPMVQTANEARQAVCATRYFPKGIRGMAGNQRASNFGRNSAYLETYEQEQCLIAQIESPQAIEAIEDIAAVEGIDALFIGPNDLATNMGMLGKTADAGVKSAIASAIRRINATGKASGVLNFVPSEARQLLRDGVSFVAVGADSSLLARRTETLLSEIKTDL